MKTVSRKNVTGLCLALLIAASAFSQGLYWESTTTSSLLGDKTNASRTFAMPKMFKIVSDAKIMILRMDQEKVYDVNPATKTYSEMTFADMEAYAKKAGDKMAQFNEKMKNLPPDQQKKMEAFRSLLPGKGEAPIQITASDETKTVSGYPCTKYVMTRGGKEFTTLWVTKGVGGFDNLKKDWMEFGRRMATVTGMTGLGEAYLKIDGFPMETDMDMMGKMTTVVTKVEKRSTPASEFNVPAGYTKVESSLMQGGAK